MPTKPTPHATSILVRSLLCTACFALPHAHAGTVIGHCVSTAQQLQNALSSASTGGQYNGSDNRIKLVQGLYQTRLVTNPSPGTFYYDNQADTGVLSIEGGYNGDCSERSADPLTTLLDGNFLYQVMDLRSRKAQIKVSGVTIENGESASPGAGLSISDDASDHSPSLVFDTIIRNNHATNLGGGLYIGSDGAGNRSVVHHVLIVDNSADNGYSAVEIVGNGDGTSFYDNTVYGNSVPASAAAQRSVYIGGSGACDVANNIIDHNPNGGLWMSCSPATLYYNDIGNILNDGGATRVGNVSIDPGFVDAAGGNFHLASGSPLLGMSPYLIGGTDFTGMPYPGHGHQDIGIYEDTVFTDGFDESVLF